MSGGDEVLTITMPGRKLEEIAQLAAMNNVSVDEQVRRLLVQGLDGTVSLKRGQIVKQVFPGPFRP